MKIQVPGVISVPKAGSLCRLVARAARACPALLILGMHLAVWSPWADDHGLPATDLAVNVGSSHGKRNCCPAEIGDQDPANRRAGHGALDETATHKQDLLQLVGYPFRQRIRSLDQIPWIRSPGSGPCGSVCPTSCAQPEPSIGTTASQCGSRKSVYESIQSTPRRLERAEASQGASADPIFQTPTVADQICNRSI